MEEECQVEMLDYLAEVSSFEWPEGAAYCRHFNGGAQFFSEDEQECGFMPFLSLVFKTEDVLTKRDVMKAQLYQAEALVDRLKLELMTKSKPLL